MMHKYYVKDDAKSWTNQRSVIHIYDLKINAFLQLKCLPNHIYSVGYLYFSSILMESLELNASV